MARLGRPFLQVIDFVDDLRLVEADGSRGRLFVSMSHFIEFLTRAGAHFHTRWGRALLAYPVDSPSRVHCERRGRPSRPSPGSARGKCP